MHNVHCPIIGFSAPSGTGKTTLLKQLIPLFKHQQLRVGFIKHSHHNFQIDKPGKDSFTLRAAGATPVMLVSSHRRAIITEFTDIQEPKLNEQLTYFDQTELDLILVEGFKNTAFPKIELHRPSLNMPLRYKEDLNIIAIASDEKIPLERNIPQLDLNNPGQLTTFIMQTLLNNND